MFVRESKYNAMREHAIRAQTSLIELRSQYSQLAHKWGALVDRVNSLGGESFLKRGEAQLAGTHLNADDIQRLLMLCHPDKHDGKAMAVDMTVKLLAMKAALK